MMEFLIYNLKVAALIAVFYMFYRLLLSRETFHRVNRIVLLATAVASFVLPLCVITLHQTVVVKASSEPQVSVGEMMAIAEEPAVPLWQTIVTGVFFAGMAATLGYMLLNVLRVWLLIRSSERHTQSDGTVICVTNRQVSPFSWMHFIVLSRCDYNPATPELSGEALILAHERGHICQHHSLDLLLVDTLAAMQWFNPAIWMLRQDLRAIHEYEADAAALSQGINMRQYQYLLIQKAVSRCGYSVANGISHSTLKNRIHMMLNNKKTNGASWLKLLAMLPVVGAALALNAETVNDYIYEDTQQQPQGKIVKKGQRDGKIKMNAKTIEVKADKDTFTGKNVTVELDADKLESKNSPVVVVVGKQGKSDPLIIIDGKVATREQLTALDEMEVDRVDVLKSEEAKEVYGKIYNDDANNGVIVIVTKAHAAAHKALEEQDSNSTTKAFDVVEQMPEFPGGTAELMKFLSENVLYPAEAEKAKQQGRVIVSFIVETDGTVSNPKVLKKVSDPLDAEAVRVVSSMPKWKPGMQNGEAVRVKYTIPITFRLK